MTIYRQAAVRCVSHIVDDYIRRYRLASSTSKRTNFLCVARDFTVILGRPPDTFTVEDLRR